MILRRCYWTKKKWFLYLASRAKIWGGFTRPLNSWKISWQFDRAAWLTPFIHLIGQFLAAFSSSAINNATPTLGRPLIIQIFPNQILNKIFQVIKFLMTRKSISEHYVIVQIGSETRNFELFHSVFFEFQMFQNVFDHCGWGCGGEGGPRDFFGDGSEKSLGMIS